VRKADRSRNSHRSEAEDAAPVSRAVADVAVVSLAAGDAAAVAGVAVVDVAVVDGVRRLRAKPDKKFVDGQAAIPSW